MVKLLLVLCCFVVSWAKNDVYLHYRFDGQSTSFNPPGNSAVRIQADVHVIFDFHYGNKTVFHMQLSDVFIGNASSEAVTEMDSLNSFDRVAVSKAVHHYLELPWQFQSFFGELYWFEFASMDHHWSRDIKRAISNMFQHSFNINYENPTIDPARLRSYLANKRNGRFANPEKTIEGDCMCTYIWTRGEPSETFQVVDYSTCNDTVMVPNNLVRYSELRYHIESVYFTDNLAKFPLMFEKVRFAERIATYSMGAAETKITMRVELLRVSISKRKSIPSPRYPVRTDIIHSHGYRKNGSLPSILGLPLIYREHHNILQIELPKALMH